VTHLGGGSGGQQNDAVFNEFHRGQERFIRKYHGLAGLAVSRVMMVIGSCLRIGIFAVTSLGEATDGPRRRLVRKWGRILTWTLGNRGAGLAGRVAGA
jgi:hypothetical protein